MKKLNIKIGLIFSRRIKAQNNKISALFKRKKEESKNHSKIKMNSNFQHFRDKMLSLKEYLDRFGVTMYGNLT
jgi:hypothetical protein